MPAPLVAPCGGGAPIDRARDADLCDVWPRAEVVGPDSDALSPRLAFDRPLGDLVWSGQDLGSRSGIPSGGATEYEFWRTVPARRTLPALLAALGGDAERQRSRLVAARFSRTSSSTIRRRARHPDRFFSWTSRIGTRLMTTGPDRLLLRPFLERSAWPPTCIAARTARAPASRTSAICSAPARSPSSTAPTRTRRSPRSFTTSSRTSSPSSGRAPPSARSGRRSCASSRPAPTPTPTRSRRGASARRPTSSGWRTRTAGSCSCRPRTSSTTRGRSSATCTASGPALWDRFNKDSDQLWYYRALVSSSAPTRSTIKLIDELDRTVTEMERLGAR